MKNQSSLWRWLGGVLMLYLGRWLDSKGMAALAETCYRNAGNASAESAFRLSQLLMASARDEEAVTVCKKALSFHPAHARIWCALGAAQRRLARMEEAKKSYENAVTLAPDYAQAWSNLGEWLLVRGEKEAALDKLERALKLEPRLMEALNNRVAALYELGRFNEAERMAREAIDAYPGQAALHANLGNILLHTGKARQAAKSYQKALECDHGFPEAHLGLAILLGETHRLAETLAFRKHEIAVKGENAQRLAALALAQQAAGDRAAAEETCHKVLVLQPNNVSALVTLATCLSARGDHRGAIAYNERALAENPDMPAVYSNIAFSATYLDDASPSEVFAYHREWANRFDRKGAGKAFSFDQTREPGRPLRIGYVSGDFGVHPVGFLLRDVAKHHNREMFRIHCYSMMRKSDEITTAIREHADVWTEALFMSDDELSEQIHKDQIDILIDLSGHTAYNRLPVFVRQPAPVQATWIGYFHSTGLNSIDYFITDPHTTPSDSSQLFSEMPVWLPSTRFCYSPPPYAPAVSSSPVHSAGRITFGCFNRVEKLVEPVIQAWAAILKRIPSSRLLLKAGALSDVAVRDSLRTRFAAYGLDPERLEMRGSSSHDAMLAEYGDVDIALDPFPFNGGMTTFEALWMGVPLIALAGNSVVSRQSTSALVNIGMDALVFGEIDAYIRGAVELAGDIERLSRLRAEIRSKMGNSPICQPIEFAKDLEHLYRCMWQAWCRGEKLGSVLAKAAPDES